MFTGITTLETKMNYKIAICDDEAEQAALLKSMVSAWADQENHTADIALFSSAQAFLFDYEQNNPFDILLLDVEMQAAISDTMPAGANASAGINGIELAKKIRETDRRAEIIFVTSHFEFIGEGYEVDALHYLVKPVAQAKLSSVLTRAAKRLMDAPASVIISCAGESIKLTEDKILYVESFLHYVTVYTSDAQYKIKESISAFEGRLSDAFFRIHRSYIVSLTHITRISRTSVTLEGGAVLPLSRGQYDNLNRAFIRHN